jgi:hypothetical protein
MKTVTRFQAKDGRVFDSEFQCRHHEDQCAAMEAAREAVLPLMDCPRAFDEIGCHASARNAESAELKLRAALAPFLEQETTP